jgi:hypothetical protein
MAAPSATREDPVAFKINFDDEHGDDPVTSIQALRQHGLDVATIASCAPPNEKMGVRGCKWWVQCPFRFKGTGPQWVGVQHIHLTGHRKDRVKACFAYVRQRERHMDQGEVWRVIAYQGDPFVWRVVEATLTGEKGAKSRYREVRKEEFVPTWPAAEDHPRLHRILYATQAFDSMHDEQIEAQQAEALSNMTGHDPAFWRRAQGPLPQGGDGGEADQGSREAEQAPAAPSRPERSRS